MSLVARCARHWLRLAWVGWLLVGSFSAWASPVVVLYHRATAQSLPTNHPAAMAVLQGLEQAFVQENLEVLSAPEDLYRRLANSVGVMLNFSRDAGFVVLVDVSTTERAYTGTEFNIMAAQVRARLTLGPRVLGHVHATAQVRYRQGTPAAPAQEAAARQAVASLAGQLLERLQQPQSQALLTQTQAAAQDAWLPTEPAHTEPLVARGKRHALLVGVSDFSQASQLNPQFAPIHNLPAVRNDINLLRQTLIDIGYPAQNVVTLVDAQASTAAVLRELERLQSLLGPDDLLFFYLGSHGLPSNGSFTNFGLPVLFDTRVGAPSALDFERLKTLLKAMPAQQVVWANDTCHAGGALSREPVIQISSRGLGVSTAPPGFDAGLAAQGAEKHFAVLASSRHSQLSYNTADNRHGVFTLALRQALVATRGLVSLQTLYSQHLEAQVPQAARQLPCRAGDGAPCPREQQPGLASASAGHRLALGVAH